MNTTMVDGAEQRLDAQIAEERFGQPGMSKMDVANRVRELRGDGPALLVAVQGDALASLQQEYDRLLAAFDRQVEAAEKIAATVLDQEDRIEELEAALAAQPSPGGQADALAMIGANLRSLLQMNNEVSHTDPMAWANMRDEIQHGLQLLDSALAARQPVGEPAWQKMESAPKDGTVVLGLLEGSDIPQSIRFRDGWEIAWDAYRIPAHDGPLRWAPLCAATPAQQPAQVYLDGLDRALGEAIDQRDRYHQMADDLAGHIAAITGVDIGEHSSANCPWQNAIEAAEEYKPAQAVDLGQFRPFLVEARDRWNDYGHTMRMAGRNTSEAERKAGEASRLIALIDGKAVGK